MCEFGLRFHPKFASYGQINNIPALVEIMTRRQPDEKPLDLS